MSEVEDSDGGRDYSIVDPNERSIAAEDVDRLLAYLPWLERVTELEPHELYLDEEAGRFYVELYRGGWIIALDWIRWKPGRRLFDEPSAIRRLGLLPLRKLCTTIVRADRFAEGTYDEALARGVFLAVAKRLQWLRERGKAP